MSLLGPIITWCMKRLLRWYASLFVRSYYYVVYEEIIEVVCESLCEVLLLPDV